MTLPKFDPLKSNLIVGETMIEANAGTGKTFTLCRIVERLVLEKRIPIERILAVTFTNAAAFELKEKIREGLYSKRISLPDEDITGKIHFQKLLQTLIMPEFLPYMHSANAYYWSFLSSVGFVPNQT